jgi:integrase
MKTQNTIEPFLAHIKTRADRGEFSQRNVVRYGAVMHRFGAAFGSLPVDEIEKVKVEDLLHKDAGNKHIETARQELAVLRAYGRWLRDYAHALPEGPTVFDGVVLRETEFKLHLRPKGLAVFEGVVLRSTEFKAHPGLREAKEVEYYDAAALTKIFRATLAKPHLYAWIPVLVFLFFGGVPLSQILRMRWKDISLERGTAIIWYGRGREKALGPTDQALTGRDVLAQGNLSGS